MRTAISLLGIAALASACVDNAASSNVNSGCTGASCLDFQNGVNSGTSDAMDGGSSDDVRDSGPIIVAVGLDSGTVTMTDQDAGMTQPPTDAGMNPPEDAGMDSGDGGSQCTPDTYTNYAGAFFTANCNDCHSHTHFELLAGYLGVKIDQSDISNKISTYAMPQGATLSTSDYNRILKWFSCGMPQ